MNWIVNGVLVGGAGAMCAGMAPILGHPIAAVPLLVCGAAGGVATMVSGRREARRQATVTALTETLRPLVSLREPEPVVTRARSWFDTGTGPTPKTFTLRYAPAVKDIDPKWRQTVLAACNQRLQATYTVTDHDEKRCRIELTVDDENGADPHDPQRKRATLLLTKLLGEGASITKMEQDDDGVVTAIEATHRPGQIVTSGHRARLETAISLVMPGERWRAKWQPEQDCVRFEHRPKMPVNVWSRPITAAPSDLLQNYDRVAIPYAVDEDGRELTWTPQKRPHALIVGGTGYGKTNAMHTLLANITAHGWPVWVLDGKQVEFTDFRGWPNVQVVADTIEQQVSMARQVYAFTKFRYDMVKTRQARLIDFEPLVVILDELSEFRGDLMQWYAGIKVKGDPSVPRAITELASVARLARKARVHLVTGLQRPDTRFIEGEARDNYAQRMSYGPIYRDAAAMMWRNHHTGTTLPSNRRGRCMATDDKGQVVEAQGYRFPSFDEIATDPEQAALLEQLRPRAEQHPRLLILPPESAVTYEDYADVKWGLAADHPDLDPLHVTPDYTDARRRSSTTAMLGLRTDDAATAEASPIQIALVCADDHVEAEPVDLYPGHHDRETCMPGDVEIGDLVLSDDEDPESWVIVDDEPSEDPLEPNNIMLSWRDADDGGGALSLPGDVLIDVRRADQEIS